MRQATYGARAPFSPIRILTTVAVAALLAGCQVAAPTGGGTGGEVTRNASVQLIERDVEAPEIFQVEDRALWDGRPSLGGVWIASPDVTEPERVLIRNTETGKFVIGALFKRERINPGPPLQLSSDAAAALGVIAGAPVVLDVVALRREELPEAAPMTAAAAQAPELPEVEADAPEAAVAAVVPDAPETEAKSPVQVLRASARALADRRAAMRRAAEAEAAAAAAVPSDPEGAAVPEVTQTSLDAPVAVEPEVAASEPGNGSAPRRRGLRGLFGGRAEAPEAPAPLPAEVTRAVAEASGFEAGSAYIQIGLYSVEANARAAALALSREGILPTVRKGTARGRDVWNVTVGPAPTRGETARVLRKARDLGFDDAYAVTG